VTEDRGPPSAFGTGPPQELNPALTADGKNCKHCFNNRTVLRTAL